MVRPDPQPTDRSSRSAARIARLPGVLANQIAAGEVVERPASVVKELLENSVDAGATRIDIDIERGGTALICIRDDGCGIHKDDLVLALSRHATSKVATLADLESVRSLGFRGEALPSIASVARVRLASRSSDQELAWEIRIGGEAAPETPRPVSLPAGTLIEVRDLFYNTPARRKFLRTERTEYRHVEDVVRRVALSRFEVAIRLAHDGKQVWSLPAAPSDSARRGRLARLCGKRFAEHALALGFERAGMRAWGWAGNPQTARSQSDLQLVFLNGRTVRDRVIGHAVRQAYEAALAPGTYPQFVIYLEMDPKAVDVNVHPAKHEVKFRESRLVHDFIHAALRRCLDDAYRPALGPAPTGACSAAPRPARGTARPRELVAQPSGVYAALGGRVDVGGDPPGEALGRALCALHHRYLLALNRAGLVLIEWRAALAELQLRRLRAALDPGRIAARPLLLPARVELSASRAERLEAAAGDLEAFGIVLRRAGPQSVAVHEVPVAMSALEPAALLSGLGDYLGEHGAIPAPRTEGALALLRLLATHSAAHAGPPAGAVELDAFLRQIESLVEVDPDGGTSGAAWCRQLEERDLASLLGEGA